MLAFLGALVAAVVQAVVSLDTLRFALFLGSVNLIFRAVRCLLAYFDPTPRTDTHRLRMHSAAAGFASGFGLLLDSPDRRGGIAVYAFARGLAIAGTSLIRQGHMREIPFASQLAFGLSNVFIVYGALFEPALLPRGYLNFILNAAGLPDEALQRVFRDRRALLAAGVSPVDAPMVPCNPQFHAGSCARDHVLDLALMSKRSLPTYLPVHWLPLVLFKRDALRRDFWGTIRKTLRGTANSVMFLNSYGFIVKATICSLRNLRGVDDNWHACLAGIGTAGALWFEAPGRAAELAIYCAMRAMQIAHALLVSRGLHVRLPFGLGESVLAAVAMAVFFSVESVDLKPSVASLRRFAFAIGEPVAAVAAPAPAAAPVAAPAAAPVSGAGSVPVEEGEEDVGGDGGSIVPDQ